MYFDFENHIFVTRCVEGAKRTLSIWNMAKVQSGCSILMPIPDLERRASLIYQALFLLGGQNGSSLACQQKICLDCVVTTHPQGEAMFQVQKSFGF